jgi:hypothetical protein
VRELSDGSVPATKMVSWYTGWVLIKTTLLVLYFGACLVYLRSGRIQKLFTAT